MLAKVAVTLVAVFFLFFIAQPALADTFEVTGSANTAICPYCSIFSYDLIITTGPLGTLLVGGILPENVYTITSISGQIAGYSFSSVVPAPFSLLMTSHGSIVYDDPIPDGTISFVVDGYIALIRGGGDTIIPGDPVDYSHTVGIFINDGDSTGAWCTWNVARVPEPPTIVLLGPGCLCLAAATLLRRLLS
ncbi:MAG TPA: hypothetical protein VE398_24980 [Acidobacteriota bacterium]|nr:hypothetical protein [Acidobacteriota bacterium]